MLRSATWTSALTLLLTGCTSLVEIPDQSQFEDLDTLVRRDEAFVRVYIAPARGADLFATHPWFVVKESGERLVTRWEVSHRRGGPHNHVKRNFREPEADVGAGGTYILTEIVGAEADEIAALINQEAPHYPCQNVYIYFPGPNSNTFVQWMLQRTAWDVTLPATSFGQYMPALCPLNE